MNRRWLYPKEPECKERGGCIHGSGQGEHMEAQCQGSEWELHSELFRVGRRWLCRGADVSLQGWVVNTGREECEDVADCWGGGSIAVTLKTLHGRRIRSK